MQRRVATDLNRSVDLSLTDRLVCFVGELRHRSARLSLGIEHIAQRARGAAPHPLVRMPEQLLQLQLSALLARRMKAALSSGRVTGSM